MKPITFSCAETLSIAPDGVARHILAVSKWPEFKGYFVLPGIKVAEFEFKTPGIVGSRIRGVNTAPLSRLGTGIEETWDFKRNGNDLRQRSEQNRERVASGA